jgi:hypothetical protein
LRKHERSVLKKSLSKKPKVRENVVGSPKVVHLRQMKAPQTRRDVVGSPRVVRQRQMKVPQTRPDVVGSAKGA